MKIGYIYIVAAAVIFSTMEIAGRLLGHSLNATQINFWRFFISSSVLLPMTIKSLRKRHIRLNINDLLYFLMAGFIGIFITMEFYQVALVYTKASVIAIIVCSNPVVTVPFACLFLHEEFSKTTALSLALCITGILFILNPLQISADGVGVGLGIASAIGFALYSVIGMHRARRYGAISFTCLSFASGTMMLLLGIGLSSLCPPDWSASGLLGQFSHIPLIRGLNGQNILVLLYFGVVGTGISYLLYFKGMEETSASTGSVAFFIKPALAPILAFLLLGEQIPVNVLVGIGFIVLGSYFVFTRKERRVVAAGAVSGGTDGKSLA